MGLCFDAVIPFLVIAVHSQIAMSQGVCQPQTSPYELGPHPHDCSKYMILCQVGGPEERDCPPGTVFSDVINNFVHRLSEFDTCTSANAVRECELGKVDLIPHPTSCQGYFNCSDTTDRPYYSPFLSYEDECIYPNLFDINVRQCTHYSNAECGNGRIEAKWKCDYLRYSCPVGHCTPCSVHNPSCVGKEDGLWPNPGKLWSPFYIQCDSERPVGLEKRCEPEPLMRMTRLFHPEKRQCLPLWDIPVEHNGLQPTCESNTPGFYESDDIEIVAYHCPGEEKFLCRPPLFYDYNLTRCTPLQSSTVSTDPLCIDKEDGLWPNPAKLWTQYYVECQAHQVKSGEQQCPEVMSLIQVFHPEDRKCTHRWDIPREHGGFLSTCDSKEPGYYSYHILAFKCPGEEKFLCRPPLYFDSDNDDVSRCDPIDGNDVNPEKPPINCNKIIKKTKQTLKKLRKQQGNLEKKLQDLKQSCEISDGTAPNAKTCNKNIKKTKKSIKKVQKKVANIEKQLQDLKESCGISG